MLSADDNGTLTQTARGTLMGDHLRRFWTPFLLASELPTPNCPPVRVRLMSENLVAFRATDGTVGLVQAACPHRRASLFWGRNEENGIRCVYHGWKFDTNGQCVDMPSEPDASNFKNKIAITAYPTADRGGVIWAYLGPSELAPELPTYDWLDLPETHRYSTKRIENVNWAQALEGGIDSAHSNFLHARVDAFRRDPAWVERAKNAPDLRSRYHALDRSPRFFATYTDYGMRIGARREAGNDGYYWRFTHWLTPYYNLFAAAGDEPGANGRGFAWVPIDDHHSWTITFAWNTHHPLSEEDIAAADAFAGPAIGDTFFPERNATNDYLIDRDDQANVTFTGIAGIQAQDMAVQESMGAIVDRTQEHLGTSDSAIIMMRRQLLAHARATAEGSDPYAAYHGAAYRTRTAEVVVAKDASLDEARQRELCALDS
jgi:phthalate 4,5-dioxygenase